MVLREPADAVQGADNAALPAYGICPDTTLSGVVMPVGLLLPGA